MSECTQPDLWASRPRSDASEEEVARYLAHVDQCSFHAELEAANDRSVRGIAAFAVGDLAAIPEEKRAIAKTKWTRTLRLSLARVEYQLGFRGGELRWATALKLAAVIALLAALLLLPLYFLRDKPAVERANAPREEHSPSPSPSEEVITQQQPSPTVDRNVNNNRSAQTSIANVKRIYIAEAEEEFNQLLREALINELRQSGRFTVVTRAADADAILETESTRGPNVRVQLVNRAGKALWFTMQSTSDESGTGAKDTATRIVRALSGEATPQRSP